MNTVQKTTQYYVQSYSGVLSTLKGLPQYGVEDVYKYAIIYYFWTRQEIDWTCSTD